MTPEDIFIWLGRSAGGVVAGLASGVFEVAMQAIWISSLWLLREAFTLVDSLATFTVSKTDGPVGTLWSIMVWLGGVLALGLFFWQITVSVLRGGRGFTRVMSGPFQYGAALAVTVGAIAGFLAAADGTTSGILNVLHVGNFSDALKAMNLVDAGTDSVKAVVLGLTAIFGLVPAVLGFAMEMVFREAAVYLLTATVPIIAAGLISNTTAVWFWRGMRWMLAIIFIKPGIALVLVIGIGATGEAKGLSGLLAGVAILWMAVWVPLVLFKLFAFIDPNTEAGAAVRGAFSDAGMDSYGSDSPGGKAGTSAFNATKNKLFGGSDNDEETGTPDDSEAANTDRFDSATDDAEPAAPDDEPSDSTAEAGDRDGDRSGPEEGAIATGDSDSPPPDSVSDVGEAPETGDVSAAGDESSESDAADAAAGVLPEAAAASAVEAAVEDDNDDEGGDPNAGKVLE
ncbi:hypothetical protein [Amycolatopsis keratiniphila]|uniref:hypothetical protein n=1 Tax=Amycolatopsis keratiniphila TaxID=129921 RepID=UPI000879C591|nr:hypothetical protein [Amycolatopsis keratiniphila]OLZ50256.1 hypothetical protein BS330_28720 [Amycolatopsis keratiniphila subsp. nogabecina]SDU66885.1 hypothetical protein SAMN04489733_8025 [Amycolatopsis keratiniphila]